MLSYEDIFYRHNPRPLSYLPTNLESPILRRRSPVTLRSSAPQKDRRPRPLSASFLDFIPASSHENSRTTTTKLFPDSPPASRHTPRSYFRYSCRSSTDTLVPDAFVAAKPAPILRTNCRLEAAHAASNNYKLPPSYSDSSRFSSTFSDSRLRRRELPLCTPDELLDIIREPSGYYALPTDPWNEVYPDIYLSDAPTALCTSVLKKLGVTHVLNAAQGREKGCGQVNTTTGFYSLSGIEFLGVPAFDNIVFKIHPYFEEAAEFIDEGLKSGGKVLVHCRAGISRSATLVCAFLMMRKGMSAQEAVKTVRKKRAIIPNDGFLQQLCDLNDKLKRKKKL